MKGVDLRTLGERFGHRTFQMTMHYAHLSADHERSAVIASIGPHSFLISSSPGPDSAGAGGTETGTRIAEGTNRGATLPKSELDEEYAIQARINAPDWKQWDGEQIETSMGDIRQLGNRTAISFSILNRSDRPVEIVPPQIQISGRKQKKRRMV